MTTSSDQEATRIVNLYRSGRTGFEIATETGEKLCRVYDTLRDRLGREELAEIRRRRASATERSRLQRLAARWLDAVPLLRRGQRVKMMTVERRIALAEELDRFLAHDQLITDGRAFLEVALAFSEIRPASFVVTLLHPGRSLYPQLLVRDDLDELTQLSSDASDIGTQHAEHVRLACIVSKGRRWPALETEVALLSMPSA